MLKKIRNLAAAIVAAFGITASGYIIAFASQGSTCLATTGTVSGLTLVQNINGGFAALVSMFSGATAPVTDCTAASVKGQMWLDTNTHTVKQYDGNSWLSWGVLDLVSHIWQPVVGGGTASVASGSTVDIGAQAQTFVTITGSTTITSFGSNATPGSIKLVKFESALTLTHSANLILPAGATNITTEAGDQASVVYLGGGAWSVWTYTRASGAALVNPALDVGIAVNYFGGAVPAKYLLGTGAAISRASYPAYVSATTVVKSAGRSSGSPTLSVSSGDTVLMGAGMPVEGTGIPSGTTILYVTSTSIVLSANASTTGTGNVTVFLNGYGTGGDATTIGLPNCIGRAIVGVDGSAGVTSNTIQVNTTLTTTSASTSATVGSATGLAAGMFIVNPNLPTGTQIGAINGTTITLSAAANASGTNVASRFSIVRDAQALGSIGGLMSIALTTARVPAYTPTGSVSSSVTGSFSGSGSGNVQTSYQNTGTGGAFSAVSNAGGISAAVAVTVSGSISGSAFGTLTGDPNGGRAEPFTVAQPMITAQCMVRVIAGLIPANDNLPFGEGRYALRQYG